jgi:hypothetical protein
MRKLLPFGLLIPVAILLGLFVVSQCGYALPYGSPSRALLGAVAWLLLFLIVYGHMQGWRSVRAFLIVFVVGKFAAILYRQLTFDTPISRLLMELAAATIIAWLMFGFFWPARVRDEKTRD